MPDPTYIAQLVLSGLLLGGLYALLAVGLTLIYGVMHFINLAHGDFMIVGAFVTYVLWNALGLHPLLILPIVMVIGFIFVIPIHKTIFEPILDDSVINQLLLTFGLAIMLEALLSFLFGLNSRGVQVEGFASSTLEIGGVFLPMMRILVFVFALVILTALYLFLHYTHIGMGIRATSQDPTAAQVVGVDIDRIQLLVMGIGSALAFGSGALLATILSFEPFSGLTYILIAFAVVSVGGLGSMAGALVAGLVLAIFQTVSTIWVPSSIGNAILFLVFLIMLLVRPEGLFGSIEHGRGLYD